MNTCVRTSLSLLALGLSLQGLHAQEPTEALSNDKERNALMIAEQLYLQTQDKSLDSAGRQAALQGAVLGMERFASQYPRSSYRPRVLYMQASCLMELGDMEQANKILSYLANETQGEYAAAAAYKLATQSMEQEQWAYATSYFQMVVQNTQRAALGNDARFRLAKALQMQSKLEDAILIYEQLLGMPELNDDILSASLFSLAQLKTQQSKKEEAYALFARLLSTPNLEEGLKGRATLQAARLATSLGKTEEAKAFYAQLSRIQGMESYQGEAQLEQIVNLYKEENYKAILTIVAEGLVPLVDPTQQSSRDLIVGQALVELNRLEEADFYFQSAETLIPGSAGAAQAAYRRIVAAQLSNNGKVFRLAEDYLHKYTNNPETSRLPLNDVVRFLYADYLMKSDVKEAPRQYAAINLENLPLKVRPDALYHHAWSLAKLQGSEKDPLALLDQLMEQYPDYSKMPQVLVLRASTLVKMGKLSEGLADYDKVIAQYPESQEAAISWQSAAHACQAAKMQSKMIHYYEGFIENCPKVNPSALAEAHFNLAREYYQDKPEMALEHFLEAKNLDAERYQSTVDYNLVQCYFKLQRHEDLEQALIDLQKSNAKVYANLPAAIFRWCGWVHFQNKDFLKANRYLQASLSREEKESYTTPEGQEELRPKVEPIVWKTIAKTCLELSLYQDGLDAARHYIGMETLPYRKAEGMREEAQLLIGLNRCDEAIEVAEKAIEMGVDGPLKSSLFLVIGDAYYAKRNYTEAAKFYGRTANIVSDQTLKPLSLYKITLALEHAEKRSEAASYARMLKEEFPDWEPETSVRMFMEGTEEAHDNP